MPDTNAVLCVDDAADLQWYFSHGQTAFERSTTGAMLENAWLYSIPVKWWEPPPEITAYPTAEVRVASGYVPDDAALTKYARVTRTLSGVAARGGRHVLVLHAYWGDAGDRFSTTHYGRLLGLYHLTRAGQRLLKAAEDKGAGLRDLPAHERMANEVAVQQSRPTLKRRECLTLADKEAEVLYESACRAWNSARADETRELSLAAC